MELSDEETVVIKSTKPKRKTPIIEESDEEEKKVVKEEDEEEKVADIEDIAGKWHHPSLHSFKKEELKEIQKSLLKWFDENHRKLPWRNFDSNNYSYFKNRTPKR